MSAPQPPGDSTPPSTPGAPTVSPAAPPPEGRQAEDRPSTWQPWLYLKIALLLAVLAYSIAFVVENSKQIEIHFVFATARVRLIWEILLLLAIGVVGGMLLSQLYRHRRRAQLAKQSGEAGDADADLRDRHEAEREPR